MFRRCCCCCKNVVTDYLLMNRQNSFGLLNRRSSALSLKQFLDGLTLGSRNPTLWPNPNREFSTSSDIQTPDDGLWSDQRASCGNSSRPPLRNSKTKMEEKKQTLSPSGSLWCEDGSHGVRRGDKIRQREGLTVRKPEDRGARKRKRRRRRRADVASENQAHSWKFINSSVCWWKHHGSVLSACYQSAAACDGRGEKEKKTKKKKKEKPREGHSRGLAA